MIQKPMDVLNAYPVRKSRRQKQAFRDDVLSYAETLGYTGRVEKGSLGSKNVIFGDPKKVEYLITAHYDTCARQPFPNLVTPCNFLTFLAYQIFTVLLMFAFVFVVGLAAQLLFRNSEVTWWVSYAALWVDILLLMVGPANRHNANDNTSGVVTVLQTMASISQEDRERVAFVLFDLEEAGLWGSASYQGAHKKETKNQIILNLDCVGDGDEIVLFPTPKLKKDRQKLQRLQALCGAVGEKSVTLRSEGFSVYPSDQQHFPYGVGIAALRRSRRGILYCSRIHTNKDTVLEEQNVMLLSDKLTNFLKTTNQSTEETV